MNSPLNVTGHDTMSSAIKDAHNYHLYLCSLLMPYLGDRILEIGPGYGQYTKDLRKEGRKEIWAADIDAVCVGYLRQYLPEVKALVADLDADNWLDNFKGVTFDTVVALNVLEHIKDDKGALGKIRDVLAPGGQALLVVPAHNRLYGEMDKLAGHHRRYDKRLLHEALLTTGFKVREMFYINPIGGVGWYLNSRFYKPKSLSSGAVNAQILFFDKYVLPLSKLFTPVFKGFFGQSLWCRASGLR